MKKTIFPLLFVASLFSCKKDPVVCTTSVTSVSGVYRITAMTYKATSTSPETDYFTIIVPDACDRDNTYTFNANGTYVIADVGMICSPSGGDNGTWALSGNNMTIDGDLTTIESFDCKTLFLINTDTQTSGDKLKITLTKQ